MTRINFAQRLSLIFLPCCFWGYYFSWGGESSLATLRRTLPNSPPIYYHGQLSRFLGRQALNSASQMLFQWWAYVSTSLDTLDASFQCEFCLCILDIPCQGRQNLSLQTDATQSLSLWTRVCLEYLCWFRICLAWPTQICCARACDFHPPQVRPSLFGYASTWIAVWIIPMCVAQHAKVQLIRNVNCPVEKLGCTLF